MAFRIEPAEPLAPAVRRIAREQLTDALTAMDRMPLDPVDSVHDFRKCCKRVRGLLRLVRDSLADYRAENAAIRDAAARLSAVREATAAPEALAATIRWANACGLVSGDEAPLQRAMARLRERAQQACMDLLADGRRQADVRCRIEAARERAAAWHLQADDFAAIAGGLEKSYRRGRKRQRAGARSTDAELRHDWRKRAKYTRYHLNLLAPVAPDLLDASEQCLHELTDRLGDEHDLVELESWLQSKLAGSDEDDLLLAVIAARRASLHGEAAYFGALCHAEKTVDFRERIEVYWQAGRNHPERSRRRND